MRSARAAGHAAIEQPVHELDAGVRAQRLQHDGGGVGQATTPAVATLEQLVARQADDDDGTLAPAGEEVEEGEHAVVSPVDVLHHQDERRHGRDGPEVAAPGLEELVAGVVPRSADGEHAFERATDDLVVDPSSSSPSRAASFSRAVGGGSSSEMRASTLTTSAMGPKLGPE